MLVCPQTRSSELEVTASWSSVPAKIQVLSVVEKNEDFFFLPHFTLNFILDFLASTVVLRKLSTQLQVLKALRAV